MFYDPKGLAEKSAQMKAKVRSMSQEQIKEYLDFLNDSGQDFTRLQVEAIVKTIREEKWNPSTSHT